MYAFLQIQVVCINVHIHTYTERKRVYFNRAGFNHELMGKKGEGREYEAAFVRNRKRIHRQSRNSQICNGANHYVFVGFSTNIENIRSNNEESGKFQAKCTNSLTVVKLFVCF